MIGMIIAGQNAAVKQTEQDDEAERFEPGKGPGARWRQQAHQDFAAVQGRDWHQVEDGQHDIDPDAGGQHLQKGPEDQFRQEKAEGGQQLGQDAAGNGGQHIGARSGQ